MEKYSLEAIQKEIESGDSSGSSKALAMLEFNLHVPGMPEEEETEDKAGEEKEEGE